LGIDHAGFFLAFSQAEQPRMQGWKPMNKSDTNMARQIAEAASRFAKETTGHPPQSVSVVLSDTTLVITLHGALSPAEQALAVSADGAAKVQEFHRQLFASASKSFRHEIKRITGVDVRESNAEIKTTDGTAVKVFTTGTVVHVFQLADGVPPGSWDGSVSNKPFDGAPSDRTATGNSGAPSSSILVDANVASDSVDSL
jgi:uncharacterized protein YbcI